MKSSIDIRNSPNPTKSVLAIDTLNRSTDRLYSNLHLRITLPLRLRERQIWPKVKKKK